MNDDFVRIVEWHASSGDEVKSGQLLVAVETSKAVLELEAEVDGYLEVLQPLASEVAVGELIGRILAQPLSANIRSVESAKRGGPDATEKPPVEGAVISSKARVLIDEHGIDVAVFAGMGLVRAEDVLNHLGQSVLVEADDGSAQGSDARGLTRTVHRPPKRKLGFLSDARVSASERGWGLLGLAWNYGWRNWFLNHLVRLAPYGLDLGIHRLRGIRMGRGCFIDSSAIVETAYPENITLGDDVRITAGAVIMTHIKAPHFFRDTGIMPLVIQPVVIESHCFIGVNAVVMPGVHIGEASVVASGAVVVSNVPPYCMVAGNPAKVVKRFPIPQEEGR